MKETSWDGAKRVTALGDSPPLLAVISSDPLRKNEVCCTERSYSIRNRNAASLADVQRPSLDLTTL